MKFPLHIQILIGSLLGLVGGLLLNWMEISAQEGLPHILVELNQFMGKLFLRALRFVAVPVVLFSLVAAIGSLSDINKLKRIAGKTIALYLFSTGIAITLGLLLTNFIQPGTSISENVRQELQSHNLDIVSQKIQQAQSPDIWQTLLNIIPTNPFASLAEGNMLQVLFFAVMMGLGLSALPKEQRIPLLNIFQSLNNMMIQIIQGMMKMAPIAVFSLLIGMTTQMGWTILQSLLVYTGVVLLGLALLLFGLYPLMIKSFTQVSPKMFFQSIAPAQLLAFSSSSSAATLPVTLQCAEHRLRLDQDVVRFVIPMGATINMDGTALYQGVATLFIAQIYGITLDWQQQLTIVITATLASIGTAGVPGVGMIMLVIVLQSVGFSPEMMTGGLAIIFGVDRLLDMARTVINVSGDCTVATLISHSESIHQTLPMGNIAANE